METLPARNEYPEGSNIVWFDVKVFLKSKLTFDGKYRSSCIYFVKQFLFVDKEMAEIQILETKTLFEILSFKCKHRRLSTF